MDRKTFLVASLAAACLVATSTLVPSTGHAQADDPRVTKSMETLRAMTAKLGAPKLEGREAVGGKDAPALYFGTTKINNNFDTDLREHRRKLLVDLQAVSGINPEKAVRAVQEELAVIEAGLEELQPPAGSLPENEWS